ncbi:MAG: ACP S-malonyltransferase [Bacteroidales bacterium]|nr:ACP S-malonyltransferase [Bacteroidales bacterium]
MKKAYVFPGQGAQYVGMAKELYDRKAEVRQLIEQANELLGFRISDIMFSGTEEELKQTKVTQPSIFLHSTALALYGVEDFHPDMVAGHSLGEFSALVASRCLSFEDGLRLVAQRATAMQRACEMQESTMAVVLGLPDKKVAEICLEITENVLPANYNCPGQVAISGSKKGIEEAAVRMKEAGAKRVLPLKVSGAFHSRFMEPARAELAAAVDRTSFHTPVCPIYQNYTARPTTDVDEIRKNLKAQLTAPVLWTQSVQAMVADGAGHFVELGPGSVLQGLVSRIAPDVTVSGVE